MNTKPLPTPLIVLATIITFIFCRPALADEDLKALLKQLSAQVTELKEQSQRANARIQELEQKLQQNESAKRSAQTVAAPSTAKKEPEAKPAVTAGDAPGTFKIPGTNTSLGFGGYVKLDANYSSISAGRNRFGDQLLVAGQIPVGENRRGEHVQTTFHAKETRLWFQSFTPSSWGNINTLLELDFLGAPETYNYTPRLRHAYGSIGNFLAGQTWTTFLNVLAIPDTLDFTGPVGSQLYVRQPLIRWTQPFTLAGTPLEFQVAAESPNSRLRLPTGLNNETPDAYGFVYPNADQSPDIVTRLNYNPSWGSLSLSGLGRHIRYTRAKSRDKQEEWGGAVSVAGRINIDGLDNLRFMLAYGNAYGRYATFNTFEDAAMDATGSMKLIPAYSAMVAYQHWWDKTWRSTFAYGYVASDQPDFVTGEMTRMAQSAHANLLWSPTLQTTFGLEYIYALRERVDGRSGDLHRLLVSARFNF